MAYNNSIYFKRLNLVLFTGLIMIAVVLINSCKIKPLADAPDPNFNKVLDTANYTYDKGKPYEAVKYLDSAALRSGSMNLPQKFNYYTFDCNYYFHVKKDNTKAAAYADSTISLFNTQQLRSKYIGYYGRAFFYKGDILFEENKFKDAYEYYYKGKLAGSKDVNACALSDYSYRMGMIMYKQEHYKLAAGNFKTASSEVTACDLSFVSFYRRQELLNNTALSYSKAGYTDSAMIYYNRTLKYIDQNAGRFSGKQNLLTIAKGVVYGNQANIYINKRNYKLAKQLLQRSIAINLKKGGDNNDALLTEMKLAHIYVITNYPDSLVSLLAMVHRQMDTIKNLDAAADWNSLMGYYLINHHSTQKAVNYLVTYNALKDSIAAKNKALKEADIGQQIIQLEKEYEYNDLKKYNKLHVLYIKLGAVFGILLLIITLLIILNYRKSKNNVISLGKLNRHIREQKNNLQSTLDKLENTIQEKDRILRTVAHDLRNPIGGIAALTGLMAEDECTDEQIQLINLIHETSVNSMVLINEIMEAAENDTGHFKREPVEINGLVSNCVELLRFKAAEKEQFITMELMEMPMELTISKEKVWRVISNLISNAIKFSAEGKEITVNVLNDQSSVEINVKDNGIGIPENLKNKVFNTYTDAKRAGTAGEKSFGLGLSISKEIIESHKGNIWFESIANRGTTFFVSLPK